MKLLSVNQKVLVKRYVRVEKDGKEYVVYICNNIIAGIYEYSETETKGHTTIKTNYIGRGIKKLFGVDKKTFFKQVEEKLFKTIADEYDEEFDDEVESYI